MRDDEITEPECGRLRGGFRSGDGLQTTERAYACVDSRMATSGYNTHPEDAQSWLLESDALSEAITAVDNAPDGSVVVFIEAEGDGASAGTTVRLDPDAAAEIGAALLEASDE